MRCFGCEAKRICNMSCPTSDYNNIEYREQACQFTRKLYQYFHENQDKVKKVYEMIGKRMPMGNYER